MKYPSRKNDKVKFEKIDLDVALNELCVKKWEMEICSLYF